MKQKTKLKKMKLTSVDMCRRGANPDAYINLYKSADEPLEEDEHISKGLAQTILDAVKSALGMGEIEKKADTFNEKMQQREIEDNRWKYQDALNMSVTSILNDESLSYEQKCSMLEDSIEQFASAYKEVCYKIAGISKEAPQNAVELGKAADNETLDEEKEEPIEGEIEDDEDDIDDPDILDNEPEDDDDEEEIEEGDKEMKKIDKSLFTPEELEQYEALIAKGMVEEEPVIKAENPVMNAEIQKAFDDALAEMAEMKKSMEMAELSNVAKKYTVLGKKEDELVNTLYTMKKASPEAYDNYIAVLDESLDMVNKSGMFEEIGKSSRYMPGGDTQAKIETAATEIQKADPNLSRVEAIAKAWDQHPELVAEYENEYRK